MIPFKIRPFQALCFLFMIVMTMHVGGCDGCMGCTDSGCPWKEDDVGCECKADDNKTLSSCTPGGCSPWKDWTPGRKSDYAWIPVDKCYDGETKEDACARADGNSTDRNPSCDGSIPDESPDIEVTAIPNLENYPVGSEIALKAVATDLNKDIVEFRFDFNDGKSITSVKPSDAEGRRFMTYPVVQTRSFRPDQPGCYLVRVVAYDEMNGSSAGGTRDLSVGGVGQCSGNSSATKRQETKFTAPLDNKSFPAEYPVQLTVSVRAQLGDVVSQVEFFLDSKPLSTQTVGKYEGQAEFKWTPSLTDVGEHILTAKASYSKLGTPGETSIKIKITNGSVLLPQPNFTFPTVTTLGRMFSTRIVIPPTGSGLAIDDAAIRMGDKYCKLLASSGSTCPMYASEAAVFAESQLDNLESINDADFLIIKEPDGRTFSIYGLATSKEFADYQQGKANLTLELEDGWHYPMKLVSGDPERAKKDEIFNQMIDFTLDLLSRPDPVKPVIVSALAKTSAADFTPRSFQYLATMCLKDLFNGAAKGMKFAETTTRVLTATELNLIVGYSRGVFEGVWGGIRDDYDGVKELVKFVWSPIDRSFELYNGIRIKLDEIEKDGFQKFVDGIFESIQNTMYDFLSTADRSVLWRVEAGGGLAIEVGLRAYIAGYVSGYLTEQLAAVVAGAGAAAKAGKLVKTLLQASRAGRVVIGTVTSATAFQKRLWHWGTHRLQKVGNLQTTIAEINARMENLRTLVKDFRDTHFQVAMELGEKYVDWRNKVEALALGTAGNWMGSARTTLVRLAELNRVIPGESLSDLAATGWVMHYTNLADLEDMVSGSFGEVTGRWVTDQADVVLSRLEQVFQKMAADLPPIVKTASVGVGKKIKMRGVRIYYVDDGGSGEPFKVFFRNDYRFSPKSVNVVDSRGDTYIAQDFATAFYECRQNVGGKMAIIVDFEIDNVLDITDPQVLSTFRVDGTSVDMDLLGSRYEDKTKFPNEDVAKETIYGYGQRVAEAALAQGYSGILYPSAQVPGKTNIVLFGGKYDSGDLTIMAPGPIPE